MSQSAATSVQVVRPGWLARSHCTPIWWRDVKGGEETKTSEGRSRNTEKSGLVGGRHIEHARPWAPGRCRPGVACFRRSCKGPGMPAGRPFEPEPGAV